MRDDISVKITNKAHTSLIYNVLHYLQDSFPLFDMKPMEEALGELLENILEHAYDRPYDIDLSVTFSIGSCDLRIVVEEAGIPFDFTRYLSEPIDRSSDHRKGFYLIYDLVERFYYTQLPHQGKRFSLLQSFNVCYDIKSRQQQYENIEKEKVLSEISIRTFKDGDGDGIAKLIYRNYDYTYYKNLFYEPHEVRRVNHSGAVRSIIAEYNGEMIGHFALVKAEYSNIAEIAVATVDPRYKQMGIMNLMFDFIIEEAKRLGFEAIYGEAIMLHPYSQKANLSHGMIECAIVLGEVPAQMEIEHSMKNPMRSGVLIAELLFNTGPRHIKPSSLYGAQIAHVYTEAGIAFDDTPPPAVKRESAAFRINRGLNVGVITFEAPIDDAGLVEILEELITEHVDMIFADINLHRIEGIDTLIAQLNQHHFFYSGVLLAYYHGEDYLRLQRKNSKHVDEEHLACYSSNAKKLLEFIRNDERRIYR